MLARMGLFSHGTARRTEQQRYIRHNRYLPTLPFSDLRLDMKTFSIFLTTLLFGVATVFAAGNAAGSDEEIIDELREIAAAVYQQMDSGEFQIVYENFAADKFREGITLEDWIKVATGARTQLGANRARDLVEIRKERVLFGEPKEEFYAMLFESEYDSAKVYDRLVLAPDGDSFRIVGIWSVGRD